MIAAILSGFVAAVLLLPCGKVFRGRSSLVLALLPAAIFVYLLGQFPLVSAGQVLTYHYAWVPSLEINLDFRLDGLSMLFGLLISGIGFLVFVYSSAYLKGHPHLDRFFGYLCIFMGSMLGLVMSDNILLLFVFWELTTLSSFFLIGFQNDDHASRRSALIALAVTGGGGFFLLAGFVLLAGIYDGYSIAAMLRSGMVLVAEPMYPLVAVLLLIGAFTKSAQFPFHFWLPRAMAAPTPVSAYLHSATMVKAGIYLVARLTPLMEGGMLWQTLLLVAGGATMLFGAVHAVLRTDLKAILAYATVSTLGMLVFLTGIGTDAAYRAFVVFILAHAFYKAGLFFIAGGVDHATGTRDVTRLGGLGRHLLPLAIAGTLAAFSGGGIPGTFGFVGKDLVYEATLASAYAPGFTALAVCVNVLICCAVLIAGVKPFIGTQRLRSELIHPCPVALWLPALLLAVAGIVVGIFPGDFSRVVVSPVLSAMGAVPGTPLKVWHGFNLVLLLSGVTLAAGIVLYIMLRPNANHLTFVARLNWLAPESVLSFASRKFERFSLWYTRKLQNGYLRSYVISVVVFLMCIVAYKFFSEVTVHVTRAQLSEISIYEALVFVLMSGAIFITLKARSRLTAIVSMSVVGYCLCLMFVLFSAPDLALTQFTIDTLTIVLFVLVLLRLPPYIRHTNMRLKIRDGVISLCFGTLIALIALQVLDEPTSKMVSRFYADNAYLEGKGKNVVNVIIVDFRGFDTLVEITVLSIAAIGVYSLLKLNISSLEKE